MGGIRKNESADAPHRGARRFAPGLRAPRGGALAGCKEEKTTRMSRFFPAAAGGGLDARWRAAQGASLLCTCRKGPGRRSNSGAVPSVPPAGGMKFLLDFFTKKSRVQGRALPLTAEVRVQGRALPLTAEVRVQGGPRRVDGRRKPISIKDFGQAGGSFCFRPCTA